MSEVLWGLMGRDFSQRMRRVRTLGMGTCARSYNNKAVPGLGGVWFAKQLFLAALGVGLAEASGKGRHNNIRVTNAVEALACWLAYDSSNWKPDARLRGVSKMKGQKDLSFKTVAKSLFYVTQPMRMATVQPLPALGLVQAAGSRFNSFSTSPEGREFVRAVCEGVGNVFYNHNAYDYLLGWIAGSDGRLNYTNLIRTLSPLEPMPEQGRDLLRNRLVLKGPNETLEDVERRRNVLQWVESLRIDGAGHGSWDRPEVLTEVHWRDLQAGAAFFEANDAANAVLNKAEATMGTREKQELSLDGDLKFLDETMEELRRCAQTYLDCDQDDEMADAFCQECLAGNALVLEKLVARDRRVLRLSGRSVLPGPAYDGHAGRASDAEDGDFSEDAEVVSRFPDWISYRINNLFLLNADLKADLDQWILGTTEQGEAGDA
ncbi:MAG: hypothetical protein AAGU21_00385 [Solidesulfovibrio sp.]|uniref:hypothetical protein n=1 Tax=Solidesulfovibrio sp. TaxID=2910990 RepID=UPI00315869FD